MKNVNCPVCIWEFLHYSSASLVPAAPSPWQLPAPCSQHALPLSLPPSHTQTHTHLFSDCVVAVVRWLTHSLTSEALACTSLCVFGSLIFQRHAMHTHACCLSEGCALLVAWVCACTHTRGESERERRERIATRGPPPSPLFISSSSAGQAVACKRSIAIHVRASGRNLPT